MIISPSKYKPENTHDQTSIRYNPVSRKNTQVFPKQLSLTFCQKISHWWSLQVSKVHGFWHELVQFWEKLWFQNSEATIKTNKTSIRKAAKIWMKIRWRLQKRKYKRPSQTKFLLSIYVFCSTECCDSHTEEKKKKLSYQSELSKKWRSLSNLVSFQASTYFWFQFLYDKWICTIIKQTDKLASIPLQAFIFPGRCKNKHETGLSSAPSEIIIIRQGNRYKIPSWIEPL